MKIRVSTDGMNISVDVGDKAVELFSKIAIASPYTTCVVFLPRRYSSLSIAGRSS